MSVDYVTAFNGVRFECTTSERAFGPIMPDVDTADRFRASLGADARTFSGTDLQAHWETFQRHEKRNYFDDYGIFHDAMALLWTAWANPDCPRRLRQRIVSAIGYLRSQAMKAIPYGATTPNSTWDGRRA